MKEYAVIIKATYIVYANSEEEAEQLAIQRDIDEPNREYIVEEV